MRPEILFPLFAPTAGLKGVGSRLAPLLERVAGPRVRDLLLLAPQSLVRREPATAAAFRAGATQTFTVMIESHQRPARPGAPWKIRAFDETGFMTLLFFRGHGAHLEKSHPSGERRVASGKVEVDAFAAIPQIIHPDYLVPLDRANEIPLVEPIYPTTAGLPSRTIRRIMQGALDRLPDLPEWQDPAWLARQGWPSWREAMRTLHAPKQEQDLSPSAPARRRLAYDELLAHQLALSQRKRRARDQAAVVVPPSAMATEVQRALPYRLTEAQARSLAEIRDDLGSGRRMTRLIQGDVGSGKTVVAMLAMIDVAATGAQAALMAPTEILARQHHETIAGPLKTAGIEATLLLGRDKGPARAAKLNDIASGRAGVVVGTHALFQPDVAFRSLALTVIDEQHRFGVSERARLQEKGPASHLLTMSATPIPRSLALTFYGDLDISRLDEKPAGRRPVATRAAPTPRLADVTDRLSAAIAGGARAFWVCPMVAETETVDIAAAEARYAALRARHGPLVGLIHGRMSAVEKDAVMADFVEGRISVLVATTVVEVGVDVPEATIMVIEQAERFGLAQLHQLRGRVGRGAAPASCVLLYDPPLSEIARRRLDILRRTDDGFAIADLDLELRGGGDPLGLRQSGFPAYRLADPIAHQDLLAAAADDARLIMARDPELQSNRGRAVQVLQHLFDWRGEVGAGRAG